MCAALSTSNIEAQESSVCFHCPLVTVYWCYSTKAKKPTEHESLSHYYGFFGCMLFLYGDPPKKFNCTDRNPYASIYRQILCNLLSAACSGHFHWMMHLLPCPTFHVTDLLYIYVCVCASVNKTNLCTSLLHSKMQQSDLHNLHVWTVLSFLPTEIINVVSVACQRGAV